MTQGSPNTFRLLLTDQRDSGRVTVDIEAFFEFSFELAEDLEDLVAQWVHTAAPRAKSRQRDVR